MTGQRRPRTLVEAGEDLRAAAGDLWRATRVEDKLLRPILGWLVRLVRRVGGQR